MLKPQKSIPNWEAEGLIHSGDVTILPAKFLAAASRSMNKCLPFLILNTVILWHLDYTMHHILLFERQMLVQFQLQFQRFQNLTRERIQQDQTNDTIVLEFNFLLLKKLSSFLKEGNIYDYIFMYPPISAALHLRICVCIEGRDIFLKTAEWI